MEIAATTPLTRSRAPGGLRLIAVGDIHGHASLLDEILNDIPPVPGGTGGNLRDRLVFLGDYIDRGPESFGVIDRLAALWREGSNAVFLKGNHEDMMLRFLDEGDLRLGGAWIANGGDETLISYDIRPPKDPFDTDDFMRCRRDLAAVLPPEHRAFLDGLSVLHTDGDFIFVHAGLRPGVPLAEQEERDMLWIRDLFLDSDADFGGLVVHGHSPAPGPDLQPNRIGLDTGAGKGGYLTAGLFWGTEKAFLHAGSRHRF